MRHFKAVILGYGLVTSLSLGLAGCSFDSQTPEQPAVQHMPVAKVANGQHHSGAVRKAGVVKEPIQQVAPGPKRTAAPQIPVIAQ